MEKKMSSQDYTAFLVDIKERIRTAQHEALRKVNKGLINLYWDIGKAIVEKQEKLGWGKSVVEQLSIDLRREFPKMTGFSSTNLWYIRQFYSQYQDNTNLQSLIGEIGWTQNLLIFTKCKGDEKRKFYILHVKKFGWTSRVLAHHIDNQTYERHLFTQTNFQRVITEKNKGQANLAVKDHYTFDFLELDEEHSERELELSLIRNIQRFLVEMGNWFTFVGSQYRIVVGGNEYFIDLLLFHRKLRCLIVIELKVGAFKPEYKGKMEFYLNVLNDQVREPDEKDSIGIIICRSKNKTVVEYSLKTGTMPVGVATYSTTPKIPKKYQKYLPSSKEISEKLSDLLLDPEKTFRRKK